MPREYTNRDVQTSALRRQSGSNPEFMDRVQDDLSADRNGRSRWRAPAQGGNMQGQGGSTTADRLARARARQQRSVGIRPAGPNPTPNPGAPPVVNAGPNPNPPQNPQGWSGTGVQQSSGQQPLTQQQMLLAYQNAQNMGTGRQWLQDNQDEIARAGGRYQPNQSNTMQMGSSGPSRRVIGDNSATTAGSNINYEAINAYQNNPAMRAYMQSIGAIPTVNGVAFGSDGSAPSFRYGSASDGGTAGGRRGGAVTYGNNSGLNTRGYSSNGAIYQNGRIVGYHDGQGNEIGGGGGMGGGGGGGAGMGSPVFGLGAGQAQQLAGQVGSGISDAISNPGGMPVDEMQAQSADSIGAETRMALEQLDRDTPPDQFGTPRYEARKQQIIDRAGSERRSSFTDISARDANATEDRRLQGLGLGANWLKDIRSSGQQGLSQLASLLGMGGV